MASTALPKTSANTIQPIAIALTIHPLASAPRPAPTTANSTARLANADRAKTHWSSIVASRHSLLQPGLEERLLAGLGEFVDVLLHAGLDPTLAGWHLTAELSDVGFADLQDCPCARTHLLLRHRTRCGEQQDGTR